MMKNEVKTMKVLNVDTKINIHTNRYRQHKEYTLTNKQTNKQTKINTKT